MGKSVFGVSNKVSHNPEKLLKLIIPLLRAKDGTYAYRCALSSGIINFSDESRAREQPT